MGKKAQQLGAKGFVQLTRRDKESSPPISAEAEDDAGPAATQPEPTHSFITQVSTGLTSCLLRNG